MTPRFRVATDDDAEAVSTVYLRSRKELERRGFAAIAFGDGSANEERCPDVLYEWRPRPRTAG